MIAGDCRAAEGRYLDVATICGAECHTPGAGVGGGAHAGAGADGIDGRRYLRTALLRCRGSANSANIGAIDPDSVRCDGVRQYRKLGQEGGIAAAVGLPIEVAIREPIDIDRAIEAGG